MSSFIETLIKKDFKHNHKEILASKLETAEIPTGVKIIEGHAFRNNSKMKNATLPEGVEKIGELAFSSTELTSISIPSSVTLIENQALNIKTLTSLEFKDINNWHDIYTDS